MAGGWWPVTRWRTTVGQDPGSLQLILLVSVRSVSPVAKHSLSSFRLRVLLAWLVLIVAAPGVRGFTQELYVWQRRNGPEVTEALQAFAPRCDGFNVLAAEVSWREGRPRIVRTAPDFAALAALRRPVGLSLRVGAYPGPFAADDAAAQALAGLATELLAAARASGLEPAELQVDFDCAERKLGGYRLWLTALHGAAGKTPLVFTALPAWLESDGFAELAAVADGFVLQVHSLERPSGPDAPFTLCDPGRARRWAERAAAFARPFRVALPTYGYTLAFDRGGQFLSLAAEGPRPRWPADAQIRTVRADPEALAALARGLAAEPPAFCTGLLWFRLPVAGDRLNWDAITLATVLRGETPAAALVVEARRVEPGLMEIVVRNTGQTSEALPESLALVWPAEVRPAGGDGLAGYRLEFAPTGGGALTRVNKFSAETLLPPGRTAKVAWLRFPHEVSLTVQVVEVR